MSFSLTSCASQGTVSYKQLAEDFCKLFYNAFTNQGFSGIATMYASDALITFVEEECVGSTAFGQKLYNMGFASMLFKDLTGTAQPHGNDTILLNVTGQCAVNSNTLSWGKFSDVFVLSKTNNVWFIQHHMFKVIA